MIAKLSLMESIKTLTCLESEEFKCFIKEQFMLLMNLR